jgi:hypothetical protein
MIPLLLGTALAALPGDPVDQAAALHVSADGLNRVAGGVAGILPAGLTIPSFDGEFACDPNDAVPLQFGLADLDVDLVVDSATLVPSDGRLDLDIDLGLIATADTAVTGSCTFLLQNIDQACDLSLGVPTPIDLTLHVGIALALDPDGTFDATVDDVSYDLAAIPNPLSNCAIANVFDSLMDPALTPTGPFLITNLVRDALDPAIGDLATTLEAPLEDALAFLPLVTSLDLLGAPLDVELYASELTIDDSGLLIGLGATIDAPWDPTCVNDGFDDDGAPIQPEGPDPAADTWPPVGNTAFDSGATPYDAAVLLNADFVDAALYTVWQAGLLCVDVPELSPLDITTDLLGTLFGADYQALYPETAEADLFLSSDAPPKASFSDDAVLGLALKGLHLDTYSALEHRKARICRTDIDAVAALDADLADGTLALNLELDPSGWTFSEPTHDILPPGYADGLSSGLPTLIGGLLPTDLLPAIPLPAFQGIGVGDLVVEPTADGQWQGLFLTLDVNPEPIVIEGCEGGCNDSGGLDSTSSPRSAATTPARAARAAAETAVRAATPAEAAAAPRAAVRAACS